MLAVFGTIVISAVISTVICASGITGLAALAGAGVVMSLIGE